MSNKINCGAIAASLASTISDPACLSNSINAKIREARVAEIKDHLT